jgi:hypothetical protein
MTEEDTEFKDLVKNKLEQNGLLVNLKVFLWILGFLVLESSKWDFPR